MFYIFYCYSNFIKMIRYTCKLIKRTVKSFLLMMPIQLVYVNPVMTYESVIICSSMRSSEAIAEGQRLRSLIVIEDISPEYRNLIVLDIERLIDYVLYKEGTGPSLSRMQAFYLGLITYVLLEPTDINKNRRQFFETNWRLEIRRLKDKNPLNNY